MKKTPDVQFVVKGVPVDKDVTYSLVLSKKVKETFEEYKRNYSFAKEAGGILIGRIKGNCIYLDDLTEPYSDDKQTKYAFKRSSKGHQEYMDKLWLETNKEITYLGEWHTHNQHDIKPSSVDISNWKKIMTRANNVDTLVFIILGRINYDAWVIHDNSLPQKVRISCLD